MAVPKPNRFVTTALATRLGKQVRAVMKQQGLPWDEAFCRLSCPSEHYRSWDFTFRHGRELAFIEARCSDDDTEEDENQEPLLSRILQSLQPWRKALLPKDELLPLFEEVRALEGRAPKVIVLAVARRGPTKLVYHMEYANDLDVTFNFVGLKGSYFTRAEIDPPDFALDNLDFLARWETLLDGRPVLQLTFRESDFNEPGPASLDVVEEAIDEELTSSERAKVISTSYWNSEGQEYEGLKIGVIDLESGIESLAAILRRLNVPSGVTLRMIEPEERSFDLGLESREVLTKRAVQQLVKQMLMESLRCSPTDWGGGELTIAMDESYFLRYSLRNPASPNRAEISAELRKLCEDLAVVSWKNGYKWATATLAFKRGQGTPDVKVKFTYPASEAA